MGGARPRPDPRHFPERSANPRLGGCAGRSAAGRRTAAFVALLLVAGCVTPIDLTKRAESGGRSERREALAELAYLAHHGELRDLGETDRGRIDAALRARFGIEPDPSQRARILAIAIDAPLPCGLDLLRASFADPGLAVRMEAVARVEALPPAERRGVLSERLLDDADSLVRIAAACAYRELGEAPWARELVQVIVDERASPDLRFHAYLSAVELTGADLMFLAEEWQAWLEEHGS